ncbi:hypothetical protein Tco_0717856 [Tanacetum coccineum]
MCYRNSDELGLEGMDDDDDDEVPLVEGVFMGAFGRVGELGLLEGGGVVMSSSLVKSMISGFFQMAFTVILGVQRDITPNSMNSVDVSSWSSRGS